MSPSKPLVKIIVVMAVLAGLWLATHRLGQPYTDSHATPAAADLQLSTPSVATAQVAQTDQHPKRPAAVNPATLPADTTWTFRDGNAARTYAVARDELYVPAGPGAQRIHRLAPQPDLAALLATARTLAAQTGTPPQLVLYPLGGQHDEFSRRIVTMKVQVETDDLASVKTAATSLGLTAWQSPDYAPGHAIALVTGDPAEPLRVASALARLPKVASAAPLLAHQRAKRTLSQPTDTLFSQQWHLKNTGQQSGLVGVDINVTPVWPALNGSGVAIGIVDDGVQITHPDLAANMAPTGNYDWNGQDTDPSPDVSEDFHGTAVAGLAAARDNGIGVVGVAPEATIYGLRLIALPETDQDDADAMTWKNDVIQIKSNSWGPPDDTPGELGEAGSLWQNAVATGTTAGRGGHGTIYVWAAGNGEANQDQGTKDAYAGNVNVIPVGAITNQGIVASFSEGGPHLVVCAPGDAALGLVTTDLVGAHGYNPTPPYVDLGDQDYTEDFAGTSASAPIVAGVIALMLEANPTLGWRDVKEILLRSSTQLEPKDKNWVSRDGGQPGLPLIKHHPFYGGGLVNAQAATALAATWTDLGAETVETVYSSATQIIPDAKKAITIPLDLGSAPVLRVENVELTVNITHPFRGDLEITLTSPSGVVSTFASPTYNDDGTDGYPNWTFTSVRHWGESSKGTWTLSLRDAYKGDTGQFNSATLKVHGAVVPHPAVSAPSSLEARIGTSVTLPLATDGGAYTYGYTGLPKGITYSTTTGALSGQTTATGTYSVMLTATGAYGATTTRTVSLVIDPLPAALVGTFNGVIDRDPAINANLGGSITFTTTTKGALTGSVTLGTAKYPFKGSLNGAAGAPATASITVARKGLSSLPLELDIPLDDTAATGALNSTVSLSAWRNPWSKTAAATAYAGRYTLALAPPVGSGWPAGYSTGTIVVSSSGAVTWTLQPADGTAALKGSTTLSADGTLPFYTSIKTPSGSSVCGLLTLPPTSMPSASIGGAVSWLRGPTSSVSYANAAGFGPLAMSIHGGLYITPPSGTPLLGLPVANDNLKLAFGGSDVDLGAQAANLSAFVVTLTDQNKITLPSVNPTSLKLTVNTATGQFSGSFSLTDPSIANPGSTVKRSGKFSGVFLLQEGVGAGAFVLPPIAGSPNGTRSGSVLLLETP